ncbi:MAG: hypothetical protein NT001_00540 [Candidatus Woesearchaeota archaeon]|nr:hypothetical protein [Candidatus Woesearchaeota archaeon]
MKKRLMIIVWFTLFMISLSVVYASDCPDGYTKSDQGNCVDGNGVTYFESGDIPIDVTGDVQCKTTCELSDGSSISGNFYTDGAVITLKTGATAKTATGSEVTAPAKMEGSQVTLEGGSFKKGPMTVAGNAVCDQTCIVTKADVNGYSVSNAKEVSFDGTTISGTANEKCDVDGMIFPSEKKFSLKKTGTDYELTQGTATIPSGFSGNINVKKGAGAVFPNGAVLEEGSANLKHMPNEMVMINVKQDAILTYDANGDGTRESEFRSSKGDFTFSIDGLCAQSKNCVDITRDVSELNGKAILYISNTGEPASVIHAKYVGSPYGELDANLNSDGNPITVTEDKTELVLSTRLITDEDCKEHLMLPSIDTAKIFIDNKLAATYETSLSLATTFILEPRTVGTWSTCNVPLDIINPQSTGFFSFVGRAWGLVTGKSIVSDCVATVKGWIFGPETSVTIKKSAQVDCMGVQESMCRTLNIVDYPYGTIYVGEDGKLYTIKDKVAKPIDGYTYSVNADGSYTIKGNRVNIKTSPSVDTVDMKVNKYQDTETTRAAENSPPEPKGTVPAGQPQQTLKKCDSKCWRDTGCGVTGSDLVQCKTQCGNC